MKKFFSIILSMCLFVSVSGTAVFADQNSSNLPTGFSLASENQGKEVKSIVEKSEEYKNIKNEDKMNINRKDLKVASVQGNTDLALVSIKEESTKDHSRLAVFGVQISTHSLVAFNLYDVDKHGDYNILKITNKNKEVTELKITSDGKIIEGQNVYTADQLPQLLKDKRDKQSEVTSQSLGCQDYVLYMCGFMATFGAADLCAMLLLTT